MFYINKNNIFKKYYITRNFFKNLLKIFKQKVYKWNFLIC